MRVPVEWLKELVDFSLSPEELSAKLTMAGLEVESMERMHDDTVLEVNVTPNRPDCLSILGIAREVSALVGAPLKFPEHRIEGDSDPSLISVEIADEDLCHRYAGRDVSGVKIGESPDWMKRRIEKCGMRPINNIVDITNYVLLEMGHPLHAFDRDKLAGGKIRVARSGPGGAITTLDGASRPVPDGSLLICDGERPVAVAGVMGGAETEVTSATNNVFIESAYFLPSSIRMTSKKLGLKTESSYRFERGADIELLIRALDRAALLMSRLGAGKISRPVDVYPKPFIPLQIEVRYGRVDRILGAPIPHDQVVDIVKGLGIVTAKDHDFFLASPPSYRSDIRREIDVIEEVARFYGYDRIPSTVPKVQTSGEKRDRTYSYVSVIKETLRNAGYTEAVNYSFMNYRMLDLLDIGGGDVRRKAIALQNPINEEESHLRTTLVPSLIQNLSLNVSAGGRDVRLFEVSRVFIDKGEALPEEEHHLGIIYFKEKIPSLWKEDAPGFYLMKGLLESIMEELRIRDYMFKAAAEPFLHPGKSCDILVAGKKIGFLGELHPDNAEKLSLKISRPEALIAEINLDALFSSVSEAVKYSSVPRYPHIDRDIALIVDESLPASNITAMLKEYPTELIEDISIFDFYKGKNIPAGKKSLAFTIRYRAKDRTLTDSEIETLHNSLVEYITGKTGGIVRGA